MENLPKEIFFEEKIGTNGIKCLDYKNESDIKYIREDVVNEKINALKDALIEVQSYQMQFVQLARTTPLYNIAEKGLKDLQKECDHKTALDVGYPKCLMCGKELPYIPNHG